MRVPSTTPSGSVADPCASSRAATVCSTSGAGASRRPSASTASARSSRPAPAPPAASARAMPGAPDRDELLPELGRANPRARARADRSSGAEAVGERAEQVDDRAAARRSGRDPQVVYNIRRMLERTCLAPHAVARWAAATPDAVALEHVDGSALTYAELDAPGPRVGGGARRRSASRAGDHVATMLPNTVRRAPHAARARLAARGRGAAQRRVHRAHARLLARPRRRDHARRRARVRRRGRRRSRPTSRAWSGSWCSTTPPAPRSTPRTRRRDRAGRAAVPRHAFADVHVGHDRAVEGGDHAVGGDVPVLVVGARRRARRRATACTARCRCSTTPGARRSTTRWCAARRFVIRDRFSATAFWDDVARHRLRHRRARRPDDRVALLGAARRPTTATTRCAT